MGSFLRNFVAVGLLSLLSLPAFSDADFLAELSAAGIQLDTQTQSQVEGMASIEEMVALLVSEAEDFDTIVKVVAAAVAAHPDKAADIVSAAVMQEPAAASVIVGAAIGVVVDPQVGMQASVAAIVKAAVTAVPSQAEPIRQAAIAAAPAQEAVINAAVDEATQLGGPEGPGQSPSPST